MAKKPTTPPKREALKKTQNADNQQKKKAKNLKTKPMPDTIDNVQTQDFAVMISTYPNDRMGRSKRKMLKALADSLGIVTQACRKVNIHRATHYDWIKDDPQYAADVLQMEELQCDFGESALFTSMKAGNAQSITFFNRTKGRRRGYIEESIQHIPGLSSGTSTAMPAFQIKRISETE